MTLVEKLRYFKRSSRGASIVERKGRDGIGEKKGLTHVSLLQSWDERNKKGDHNAPQLCKLPGPHGHPDVAIANICLYSSRLLNSIYIASALGAETGGRQRLTELGLLRNHESGLKSRFILKKSGFIL